MDKTLEIVMVAVALVVAIVIVTGILQGQAGNFGSFADSQTNGSSCGVDTSKLSTYCPDSSTGTSCGSWDEAAAEQICDASSCGSDLGPGNVC